MKTYIKKKSAPIVAEQFLGKITDSLKAHFDAYSTPYKHIVLYNSRNELCIQHPKRGSLLVSLGDYIIFNDKSDVYRCSASKFEELYEELPKPPEDPMSEVCETCQ